MHKPRCCYCENPYQYPEGIPSEPEGGRRVEPPKCEICGHTVRPGVVWFGESLPEKSLKQAIQLVSDCDLLISIGTSSLVWPAARLPGLAKERGAKVIQINPDETPLDSEADINVKGKAGEVLPLLLNELRAVRHLTKSD